MHRETSYVPQNRAAHLVFGSDACGPIRRSLVIWSHYSFRSSHLLLLLFLKPANDLVTVFLSASLLTPLFFEIFFFSAQPAFKLPKKENLIGIWYSPLNVWSAFLQVVPFGMLSCARVPHPHPPTSFWLMPVHLSSLRERHFLYKIYLRLWNWVKYFFVQWPQD